MSRAKGVPPLPAAYVHERRSYENGYLLGYKIVCPVHGTWPTPWPNEAKAHQWCGHFRPGATRKSRRRPLLRAS